MRSATQTVNSTAIGRAACSRRRARRARGPYMTRDIVDWFEAAVVGMPYTSGRPFKPARDAGKEKRDDRFDRPPGGQGPARRGWARADALSYRPRADRAQHRS